MRVVIRTGGTVYGSLRNPTVDDVMWYAERDGMPGCDPICIEACDLDEAVRMLVQGFYADLLRKLREGRRRGRVLEPITFVHVNEGVRRDGCVGFLPIKHVRKPAGYWSR